MTSALPPGQQSVRLTGVGTVVHNLYGVVTVHTLVVCIVILELHW
jgi:hypothetical protein